MCNALKLSYYRFVQGIICINLTSEENREIIWDWSVYFQPVLKFTPKFGGVKIK